MKNNSRTKSSKIANVLKVTFLILLIMTTSLLAIGCDKGDKNLPEITNVNCSIDGLLTWNINVKNTLCFVEINGVVDKDKCSYEKIDMSFLDDGHYAIKLLVKKDNSIENKTIAESKMMEIDVVDGDFIGGTSVDQEINGGNLLGITNNGVLNWPKTPTASKYSLTFTLGEEDKNFDNIAKENNSFDTKTAVGLVLPMGKTKLKFTVYEYQKAEVGGETIDGDIPVSSKEIYIEKRCNGYSLISLTYDDKFVTMEGFYAKPRVSENNEEYYLFENVMKDSYTQQFTLKVAKYITPKTGYSMSLYLNKSDKDAGKKYSDGYMGRSFNVGYDNFMILDINDASGAVVKTYNLNFRGVTYVNVKLYKENYTLNQYGYREFSYNSIPGYEENKIKVLENDSLDIAKIFEYVPSDCVVYGANYTIYDKGVDYNVVNQKDGEMKLYIREENEVLADEKEVDAYASIFELSNEKNYITISCKRNVTIENLVLPHMIAGVPAVANNISNADPKTIVLSSGYTTLGSNLLRGCARLESVTIPSTVDTIEGFVFDKAVTVNCEASGEGKFWNNQWNQIVGTTNFCQVIWNCLIDIVTDGCTFTIADGEATLAKVDPNATNIVIPKQVVSGAKTYPVTAIKSRVFDYILTLRELRIPAGIKRFDENFFLEKTLIRVEIAEANKPTTWYVEWRYPKRIIWDCLNNNATSTGEIYVTLDGAQYLVKDNVATLTFQPKSVRTLDIPATINANGVNYPVSIIGAEAFENCDNLVNIVIPNHIESISDGAFYECSNLEVVTVPLNVKKVSDTAFNGCYSLACIYIESKTMVISTENYAYNVKDYLSVQIVEIKGIIYELKDTTAAVALQKKSITSAYIPKRVTYNDKVYVVDGFWSGAFQNCTALNEVTIRCEEAYIGRNTFKGCTSLKSVKGNYKYIAEYAFKDCSSLESIYIDEKISVRRCAFENCKALTIYTNGSEKGGYWYEDWNVSNCPVVWNYQINK